MTGRADAVPRVMWLLNHTAARKFEVPMLKRSGFDEVFLPKRYPNDPNFRSASVDYSEDENLTIPDDDLAVLNQADWYSGADAEAWRVANRWFDVAFFILINPAIVEQMAQHFAGIALWRAYGMSHGYNYSIILDDLKEYSGAKAAMQRLGERFFFAEAYDHLHGIEKEFIKSRALYLPLGLRGADEPKKSWVGGDRRILFVCPDIVVNTAYTEIYDEFIKQFGDLPYAIGGTQTVQPPDKNVLGYLPLSAHEKNMSEMAVMYYHSRERTHIHFHPFEAVQHGMPLIFMGGGMLDVLGGADLPGRATSHADARQKLRRILDGDRDFIRRVVGTQDVLLEAMKPSNCVEPWKRGIGAVLARKDDLRTEQAPPDQFRDRIPRIGVLCSPQRLAEGADVADAIEAAAAAAGRRVECVLGMASQGESLFGFSHDGGRKVRAFAWDLLPASAVTRALNYAGRGRWLAAENYVVPNDGISHFGDCRVWIVLDEVGAPIAPTTPSVAIVKRGEGSRTRVSRLTASHVLLPGGVADYDELVGRRGLLKKQVSVVPEAPAAAAATYWKTVSEWL